MSNKEYKRGNFFLRQVAIARIRTGLVIWVGLMGALFVTVATTGAIT